MKGKTRIGCAAAAIAGAAVAAYGGAALWRWLLALHGIHP